jgi:hypothetical protein
MSKSDEARGPRATWLKSFRTARFGRGDGGLAALADALGKRGQYRAPGTIRGWEADDAKAPIPAEILPLLEDLFGTPAPAPRQEITSPDLAAAIREQAAAIDREAAAVRELAAEIRQAGLSVMAGVEGQGRLLARLVSEQARVGRRGERPPEPPLEPDKP